MRFVKKLLLGLVGLAVLAAVVGFLLPSDYRVERGVVVMAPMDVVVSHVTDLEKHELWSPWKANDPTMRISYGDKRSGEGASYRWTSENSGDGQYTVTKVVPGEAIETDLDFGRMGKAKGYFRFSGEGGGVRVVEGFHGDVGLDLPGRYFNLFMDKMVGPYFEQGLSALKQVCEAEAAGGAAQGIIVEDQVPAAASANP